MWIERHLTSSIKQALASRPVVLLTGARQTGKSALLQRLLPKASYITLDKVAVATEAEENPSYFFQQLKDQQAILDEVQYAPSLFRELKILVDQNRQAYGHWVLTGSQRFSLMRQVQESLAGRISILHLETLSAKELRRAKISFKKNATDLLWKGGYPEIWANPKIHVEAYFSDYVQTYLERDLGELIRVNNLRDFRRFLTVCATRVGQLINYTDMAKDLAVSANTVKQWLNVLETSGIICLLSPYYGDINKRLVKAPKLYFSDVGLLSHLLHVHHFNAWYHHAQRGQLWENFVFNEIVKTTDCVPNKNLFFYRDQNAVEIDFVIENGQEMQLIEAKSAEQVNDRLLNFNKVKPLLADKGAGKKNIRCVVACLVQEVRPLRYAQYDLINPLLHDFLLIV